MGGVGVGRNCVLEPQDLKAKGKIPFVPPFGLY